MTSLQPDFSSGEAPRTLPDGEFYRSRHGRFQVRERTYSDRIDLAVIDEANGEDCGSVRIYDDSPWPYAQPNIGAGDSRATSDPQLVAALGAMFSRAAVVLEEHR